MNKNTVEKIRLLGNTTEELKEIIDEDNLLIEYGGKSESV
jgi:hypothetical protein